MSALGFGYSDSATGVLVGLAAATVGLGGYGGLRFGRRRRLIPVVESTPIADGFRMPGEFERQEAVWLVWPEIFDWRMEGEPAQKVVAELAAAIAADIPVRLAVTASQAARARSMVTSSVEVVGITAGTGWIRDDGPTFLIDDDGARRGVDWDFNNWGYAGQNRFSKNFTSYFVNDSNEAAQRLIDHEEADCYRAPLVLEGGSIHSDGQGTIITTEECLLNPNRNPNLDKAEIERYLKSYLGAKKIIWLPKGVYKDVTSGHVDNLCCFVQPSEVLLTYILTNHRVIFPLLDPEYDPGASETLARAFPKHEIVGLESREILLNGGNLHCISQQLPARA